MMTTAIDKLVANFPHPHMPPIIGQPTYRYETLAQLHIMLNSKNAASVHSNLGNGQLGLLQLTVSAAVYSTLSVTSFIVPINPGNNANIPPGSTGAVITEMNPAHDTELSPYSPPSMMPPTRHSNNKL
jgi:hypothetical protein